MSSWRRRNRKPRKARERIRTRPGRDMKQTRPLKPNEGMANDDAMRDLTFRVLNQRAVGLMRTKSGYSAAGHRRNLDEWDILAPAINSALPDYAGSNDLGGRPLANVICTLLDELGGMVFIGLDLGVDEICQVLLEYTQLAQKTDLPGEHVREEAARSAFIGIDESLLRMDELREGYTTDG